MNQICDVVVLYIKICYHVKVYNIHHYFIIIPLLNLSGPWEFCNYYKWWDEPSSTRSCICWGWLISCLSGHTNIYTPLFWGMHDCKNMNSSLPDLINILSPSFNAVMDIILPIHPSTPLILYFNCVSPPSIGYLPPSYQLQLVNSSIF